MVTPQAAKAATPALGGGDLGPLAWVLDELRKSFETATKSIKRFVHDNDSARGVDMASVDNSQLRMARQQLHQVVGALEMVGEGIAAQMVRGMEGAVQQFVSHPEKCTEAAAAAIERAGFGLVEYLEGKLGERPRSPIGLFPQFKQVQELAGVDRIHPADLWPYAWRWVDPSTPSAPQRLAYGTEVRARLDQGVLRFLKSGDAHAAGELSLVCLGLADGQTARQPVIFWKLSSGFFDALARSLLPLDLYVKRVASRILLQYSSLSRGDPTVSERLAHDLLFFCAQASPEGARSAPVLSAIRTAWGLKKFPPADYNVATFGLYDPSVLTQARKRIESLKESWSAVAGGETTRIKACVDQFGLVSDSLNKLHPAGQPLAQALGRVAAQTSQGARVPSPELAMEVATSVLFLEASLADFHPADAIFAARTQQLSERLDAVRQGQAAQPLEGWMEDLYRQVSDRQTMGTVVSELRVTLSEIEQQLDLYFRNPADKAPLGAVPGLMAQMRGVLSVLGMDQATQAVLRMRDEVEGLLIDETDPDTLRASGRFERLGESLGSLGFLIDMLSYQPVLAKKLFVFDAESGQLRSRMGRVADTEEHEVEEVESAVDFELDMAEAAAVPAPVDAQAPFIDSLFGDNVPPETLPGQLEQLATSAALADKQHLASAASEAADAARAHNAESLSSAMNRLSEVARPVTAPAPLEAPAPAPQTPAPTSFEDEDDELLEIFLDEAREVVANGTSAIEALESAPADMEQQTTLRRAFHTLKGSSRMVGLTEFGEAAWSMEQLMNAWLAEQKPATPELRGLCQEAMQAFGTWADAIAAKNDAGWQSSPFTEAALTLRTRGERLPLRPMATETQDVSAVAAPDTPVHQPELPESIETVVVTDAAGEMPAAELAPFSVQPKPAEPVALAAFELPDLSLDAPVEPAPSVPVDDIHGQVVSAEIETVDGQSLEELGFEVPAADSTHPVSTQDEDLRALVPPASAGAVAAEPMLDEPWLTEPATQSGLPEAKFDMALPEAPSRVEEAPLALNLSELDFATEPVRAEALAADEPLALDLTELDFAGAPVAESSVPADEPLPLEFSELDFTAVAADDLGAADAVVAAPVNEEPLALDLNELDFAAEVAPEPLEVAAGQATPDAHAVAETAFDASDFSNVAGVDADEYKQVGDLRISIPLYNVYLSEADEWSRQLMASLSEWSLELDHPIPEKAIAHAHSLAGSSATVGFMGLSSLARAVEHALQRLHGQSRGTPEQAQVLAQAADDIRRVLHQFAAGLLKVPAPEIVAAVEQLEPNDFDDDAPVDEAPRVSAKEAEVQSFFVEPDLDAVGSDASVDDSIAPAAEIPLATPIVPAAAPVVEVPVAATVLPVAAVVAPVVAAVRLVAPTAVESAPVAPQVRTMVMEDVAGHAIADDIDVVDAVDEDLFPIFEEEAEELLPKLGTSLREWAAHPDDRGARSQVLRGLHTLKGSARLAGALRLGEMAHRTESAIEVLGSESLSSSDIDPLLDHLDELQAGFRRLQLRGDPAAQASVETVAVRVDAPPPVAAPVAPVVTVQAPVQQTVTPMVPAPAVTEPADPATDAVAPAAAVVPSTGTAVALPAPLSLVAARSSASQAVRVRSQLLDRLVTQAGEVITSRSRLEAELGQLRGSLDELTGNLERLRLQLRDVELQAETQMQSRLALSKDAAQNFDPLEFDRFTRMQELTRIMAESVNDVATVQRAIQRAVEASEDDLAAQARQSRELQRDLLRTRMVEFESISERLYRVVRQASKETAKPVKLDITGGSIEMDRGILDRMTPAFEHLLRNNVVHGIESAAVRSARSKEATGLIAIDIQQAGNDVSVEFRDDGGGLNVPRIRERALAQGLIQEDQVLSDQEVANLIFASGFTTASEITELAGRGVGMDVVRTEVQALGGRIETSFREGQGSSFRLVLPLTTAVTHVVMVRAGSLAVGVPSNLVEIVQRASIKDLQQAYNTGTWQFGDETLPFYWSGALLQSSARSVEPQLRTTPVVIFRSAEQRVAMHVDEVLGNQEVVVKSLGPQLSRLPGLVAITALASGAVALIYNPVALASVYGEQARAFSADHAQPEVIEQAGGAATAAGAAAKAPAIPAAGSLPGQSEIPLVLVVDDSITVRRVTQRLLQREGYRVSLAADGLQGLERLQTERPAIVLSDIEMPRMDGFDFVRNIRADEKLRDLPVVMITSRIAEKHREHARELGVNHYLGKPYAEDELLGLIKQYTQAGAEQTA